MIAAAYERLQLHAGPHLQASPDGQAVALGSGLGLWHPHWQAAPAQDLHEHWFELDMIFFLSIWLTSASAESVSHRSPRQVLNGAAIGDGRIGYSFPARLGSALIC